MIASLSRISPIVSELKYSSVKTFFSPLNVDPPGIKAHVIARRKPGVIFALAPCIVNPIREDIAESFLTWIVVRHRSDRVSKSHVKKILKAIPNRIKYFDEQEFDMYPIVLR
jgi:hypothetical protein